MTKTNTDVASEEAAVRKAAADFKAAVEKARDAGLHVSLPRDLAGFDNVLISETGKAKVVAAVHGTDVDPATVTAASMAAQKAADKVIDKAKA